MPSELAATGITAAEVAVVASDVQVVTVPQEQDDLAVVDGALIVVATSERVAEQLASSAVDVAVVSHAETRLIRDSPRTARPARVIADLQGPI